MVDGSTVQAIGAIVLAPFVGSFLGVLAKRLPAGEGFVLSRSHAPCCGHTLGPADLAPLFSWVLLGRRCRYCSAPVSGFYPAIEIAALAVAAWAAVVVRGGPDWMIWPSAFLGWTLLALSAIDAERRILPDLLTLPLAPAGLAVVWMIDPDAIVSHAAGAVVGYAVFEAVRFLYRRLRGREGLGQGDSKLLAAGGVWVGAIGLPTVVLYGSLAALAWILVRRAWTGGTVTAVTELPFGPFLALGIWLVWLYGPLMMGIP